MGERKYNKPDTHTQHTTHSNHTHAHAHQDVPAFSCRWAAVLVVCRCRVLCAVLASLVPGCRALRESCFPLADEGLHAKLSKTRRWAYWPPPDRHEIVSQNYKEQVQMLFDNLTRLGTRNLKFVQVLWDSRALARSWMTRISPLLSARARIPAASPSAP